MSTKFWFYEKVIMKNAWEVIDEDGNVISVRETEQKAFNEVTAHNKEVESRYQKAKREGRAPGSS